ncbi:hypothetical protein C0993_006284 [Termitomyces sp. T159_Od127]|nr:hypothetical protein C0993_006284 [Termitomyces sp. T159_Od127]
MLIPDLSLPLATLLREGTRKAHETVENSPGAIALLSGQLPKEEYVRYLMMLWHVYDAFEQALEQHATHPSLEPTYNPALLARAPPLSADIAYLLDIPEPTWKSHPIHLALLKDIPPALVAYVDRVQALAKAPDPSPLLAHAYVRYLGDLSGGQMIRRTIGKAYGLDEASGDGLSFYAFKELQSTKSATQGEMKRIKEWFREGMNKAGEKKDDVKGAAILTFNPFEASVVHEANTAFELNTGLFSAINAQLVEEPKEIPNPNELPPEEKTYPLYQFISVIAAGA